MSRIVTNEIKLFYRLYQSLMSITKSVRLGRIACARELSALASNTRCAKPQAYSFFTGIETLRINDGSTIKTQSSPQCPSSFFKRFFGAFPVPATAIQPVIFTELFKLRKERIDETETESKVSRHYSARSFKRIELFHKNGVDGQCVTLNLARDSLESSGEMCLS